jgi:DnaK suppressor protein
MEEIQVKKFKKHLLELFEELLGVTQSAKDLSRPVDLDQTSIGRLSRMDAMQNQAMALESKRRREIQLNRIRAALERLKEGEYGYCAVCDEEINIRRLEFDPANPFCVTCAEKM